MSLRATNEEAVQSWTTRKKIREKETVFDPRKDSLITKTSGNIERSEEKAKRDAAVETLTVRDREGWGRGEREASVVQRPTCLSRWNFPRGHGVNLLKHLWACLAGLWGSTAHLNYSPHSRFYLAQLIRERQAGRGAGRGYIRLDYTREVGRQAGGISHEIIRERQAGRQGYITLDYTWEAGRQGAYHIRLYARGRQAGGISH